MSIIRGNTVGTPMRRPVPKVTNEDNGKFLRVVDGKWCATEISEGELGESLESYSDAVTVDEGATEVFAGNYEEGYEEGFEQGAKNGANTTEIYAYIDEKIGSIDTALDEIIALQDFYTGATFDELHEYAESKIGGDA